MGKPGRVLFAALVVSVLGGGAAQADVRVLCAVSLKPVLEDLAGQFAQETGQKIAAIYDTSARLKQRVDNGEPFELAILAPGVTDDLIAKNKLAPATRAVVARTSIGVAAKPGSSYSVGTADDLKAALLRAPSIATSDPAAGGAASLQLQKIIQNFGITDQVKPKLVLTKGGEAPQAIAKNQAEIAVALTSEIVPTPGVVLAGVLPDELQTYVILIATASPDAAQSPAPKALITLLQSPAGRKVLVAKGMQPGS